MSVYGTKSKTPSNTTKIFAEFRHARFFQDEDVAALTNGEFYGDDLPRGMDPDQLLYHDLELVKPKHDADKTLLNPEQVGKPKNLRQYEGTERDAFLAFKRTKIGADDKGVNALVYYEDLIDRRAYRQALADGMSADEADEMFLKGAERTDLAYAKAEYFTRKVSGPVFVMPKGTQNKDIYGDDKVPDGLDPKGIYEHAGTIPPISFEMFEVLDVAVLIAYLTFMDEVHGGRSPVQEAQFPAGDVPADDGPAVPDGRRGKAKKPA